MDATLSRRAGQAQNTPYFRYTQQQSKDPEAFGKQFTELLLKAGTYERLTPDQREFFRLCDRSWEISQEMGLLDMNNADNLQQVMDQLLEEMPTEEIDLNFEEENV